MVQIVKPHLTKRPLRAVFHALPETVQDFVRQKRNLRVTQRLQSSPPAAFPQYLNLGLSALCQARCVYCPTDRGGSVSPSQMSFELAKAIIDEAAHEEFSGLMRFSENGEALLNKDFFCDIQVFPRKVTPSQITTLYEHGVVDEGEG